MQIRHGNINNLATRQIVVAWQNSTIRPCVQRIYVSFQSAIGMASCKERALTKDAFSADKLLDTHVGSASSLIACEKFGLKNYVGFEIDKHYYDMANKKVS